MPPKGAKKLVFFKYYAKNFTFFQHIEAEIPLLSLFQSLSGAYSGSGRGRKALKKFAYRTRSVITELA